MKSMARIPVTAAAVLVLLGTTGCTKLKARDQLVKGVQAFKAGHYEAAVNHFQTSIDLDPSYATARLDLAAAYSSQVVSGSTDPANLKLAHQALDQFGIVLQNNPGDLVALRQIASLHRQIGMFDQAKQDEKQVIQSAPNDDQAYYTIGQIDWSQAYKNSTSILAGNQPPLTDQGDGNPKMSKDTCAKMQGANTQLVSDALQNLNKAVEINPNYDDAMQYLNLTYRRKADLECGNDAARKADLAQADDWVQKATGARKRNEAEKEKKTGGGVQM